MDPKAMGNLRLDRRLADRRGWIKPEELSKALDSLPDVSEKVDDSEGEDADAETPEA